MTTEAPLEQRIAANNRRAMTLMVAFGAAVFLVVTLIFLLVGPAWLAPVIGLLVAATWAAIAWIKADDIVIDLCDVDPVDPVRHARLVNVTEGLCAAMGIPGVDLYVVDDPGLNALAVGRDPRRASVVVTSGLLESTNLVELEAVIALSMYRIKAGDTRPETLAVPTLGASLVLSEAFDRWEPLRRFFALPLPWVENALARLHPGRSELDTDLGAMEFTRYPPALAASLAKMAGHSAVSVASPVTAHLWIAPPIPPASRPSVARVHAPLHERVAVLEEL